MAKKKTVEQDLFTTTEEVVNEQVIVTEEKTTQDTTIDSSNLQLDLLAAINNDDLDLTTRIVNAINDLGLPKDKTFYNLLLPSTMAVVNKSWLYAAEYINNIDGVDILLFNCKCNHAEHYRDAELYRKLVNDFIKNYGIVYHKDEKLTIAKLCLVFKDNNTFNIIRNL